MNSKKKTLQSPLDDFINQLLLTGEIFLVSGLRQLLKDECGLDISTLTAPYLNNTGNEPSNSFQTLKEQAILSKLNSEELRAANQLKLTEMKVDKEQFKLEQARKEGQQDFLVQRTETDLHSVTEIISGTLPVIAASDAFTGSAEHDDTTHNLLDSLLNRITLVLGRQGSGKTGTGFALGEYFNARHNTSFFLLGAPKESRLLLPDWIRIASRLSNIPNDCFVLIDEFALKYLSLQFNSKDNTDFREQIMLARQRGWTVCACGQNSCDMDPTITRQATCVIFREPGLSQAKSERREITPIAKKANEVFRKLPPEKRIRYAFVVDQGGFEGLVPCALPAFWSEQLSTIYGRGKLLSLASKSVDSFRGNADQHKLPGNLISDEEIFEFKTKMGYGIEKTAKELGITTHRVRKCLKNYKAGDDR